MDFIIAKQKKLTSDVENFIQNVKNVKEQIYTYIKTEETHMQNIDYYMHHSSTI